MSSECWYNDNNNWNFCGFDGSERGGISSRIYKDSTILSLYSNTSIGSTFLKLNPMPNDKSDIKIKVNGNVYTLKYRKFNKTWVCSQDVFNSTKNYTVEFIN